MGLRLFLIISVCALGSGLLVFWNPTLQAEAATRLAQEGDPALRWRSDFLRAFDRSPVDALTLNRLVEASGDRGLLFALWRFLERDMQVGRGRPEYAWVFARYGFVDRAVQLVRFRAPDLDQSPDDVYAESYAYRLSQVAAELPADHAAPLLETALRAAEREPQNRASLRLAIHLQYVGVLAAQERLDRAEELRREFRRLAQADGLSEGERFRLELRHASPEQRIRMLHELLEDDVDPGTSRELSPHQRVERRRQLIAAYIQADRSGEALQRLGALFAELEQLPIADVHHGRARPIARGWFRPSQELRFLIDLYIQAARRANSPELLETAATRARSIPAPSVRIEALLKIARARESRGHTSIALQLCREAAGLARKLAPTGESDWLARAARGPDFPPPYPLRRRVPEKRESERFREETSEIRKEILREVNEPRREFQDYPPPQKADPLTEEERRAHRTELLQLADNARLQAARNLLRSLRVQQGALDATDAERITALLDSIATNGLGEETELLYAATLRNPGRAAKARFVTAHLRQRIQTNRPQDSEAALQRFAAQAAFVRDAELAEQFLNPGNPAAVAMTLIAWYGGERGESW